MSVDPPVIDQLRESAVQQMHDLEASEALQGIRFQPLIVDGAVGATIADVVHQNNIDVVIVGTHGRTGMRKFVMGSVAEEIFRHVPCPVIALGPQVCTEARHNPSFKRVLYATDFGAESSARLSHALTILEPRIETITLMHVVPTTPITDADTAKTVFRTNLLNMMPAGMKLATPVEALVEIGQTAELIVQAARDRETDLIVLGVHPPGLMGTHLMHTAYKVMIEAPCPVMLVAVTGVAAAA